jgi:Flp pilus assembly protein TadB
MLVLMILAAVWAAVLVPPFVRNRRDARPDNSVVSFRAQLSTLERATPGTSLRPLGSSDLGPTLRGSSMTRSDAKRRRRDVLVGLMGSTGFTFLLAVVAGGTLATLLFLASAGAFGAYVYALRQLQLRTLEREAKVRVLTPRSVPAPTFALRRSATN